MSSKFFPFVIKALVDTITGGVGMGPDIAPPIGIYRSAPKIEQFFLDCGLDMRIFVGSARPPRAKLARR